MADISDVQSQQQHQQSHATTPEANQQQQHNPNQVSSAAQQQQPHQSGDRNSQLALTLRLLMQGKEVGSIIGKKGDNIKRFREVSGAKINVSDSSCPDRIVTLTGTLDEVYNAFSMICSKFGEQSLQVSSASGPAGLGPSTSGANNNGADQATIGGDDPEAQPNPVTGPFFGLPATGLLNNAIKKERSLSGKEGDMLTMNNNCTTTINNNNINAPNKNLIANSSSNTKNGTTGEGVASSQQLSQQHHPTVTMRLIVPASQCGSLIGRGGAKIKELRDLTSATIQVAPDVLPNSTERVVTINGNVNSLKSCTYQICKIMVESPPKGYVVPYRPKPTLNTMLLAAASANQAAAAAAYSLPGFTLSAHPDVGRLFSAVPVGSAFNPAAAAAANLRVTSGQAAAALSAVASQSIGSQEITIPNSLIGCVIGKGGSKINEIRHVSGANIKISNPEEGAKNRTITINGTPEAIQMAQYLITASCNGNQGSVLENITKPWIANKTARKFAPY